MTIKPLYDRVVVRRLETETTTQAGIIIPDKAAEKSMRGEIIAVGDGAITDQGERRSLVVKPGDQVLFGQYAGTEIKLDGEELMVIKEADLLAIIESTKVKEKAA